jgi:hypothetical protein
MHQAPQPRRLLLLIISGRSLLASYARAQAPARPTPGAAEDDKVTFSPFVVSGDEHTGYTATRSLAGGRINIEVIKAPSDVTVLTREFLDDLGALNYMNEWSRDPVLLRP